MAGMRLLRTSTQAGLVVVTILAIFLNACQPVALAAILDFPNTTMTGTAEPEQVGEISPTITPTPLQPKGRRTGADPKLDERNQPLTQNVTAAALEKSGEFSDLRTPTSALVPTQSLPPEEWKSWPVIPLVPENARAIYQYGLATGTNPHAFSILGDCQSVAEVFMGIFDTDPTIVAGLLPELQTVVVQFIGSFDRLSPTVEGGTTAGAVLWPAWHGNRFTCQANESPLECELRLHNPSIVIINLGTHFEIRNIFYLRRILDQLIELGILPILSTKADNRELDEHLNLEIALLAAEYNLPLWNFYAAVSDLPYNILGVMAGREYQGAIYLSDEGLELHRYTALQALTAVWQAVQLP